MNVEALQAELARLSVADREQILKFLLSLKSAPQTDSDELRLAESIGDFEEGRTVPAESVHGELRRRIASR